MTITSYSMYRDDKWKFHCMTHLSAQAVLSYRSGTLLYEINGLFLILMNIVDLDSYLRK